MSSSPQVQVRISRLTVRGVRNLNALELLPAPRLNVIAGDNGQGKTSLLEAIYLVSTTRSFRAERARDVIQQGTDQAQVAMRVTEGGAEHVQRVSIGARQKHYLLDDKRPERLASYATRTPVVVFHPGDLALVSGPAGLRRTLLDRIALFVEPGSVDDRQRYDRAVRERQRVLEERGVDAPELEAYESLVARYGARLSGARARATEQLRTALLPSFTRLAAAELELGLRYASGGVADVEPYLEILRARRGADLRRRTATFGPHRDDLELEVQGRIARHSASQGQQRLLALGLKLAELACVRAARRVDPILLLDDVSSELDPTRTGAVYDVVRDTESQVFVTTTRPELFTTPNVASGERVDWLLAAGRIVG